MGKRKKASKPQGPKKKELLPTTFQCLFCNHEKSVVVKMDKKGGVGYINCKVCGQDWSTGINFLSAPVDVYADWVDACDEAAKEAAKDGEDNGGASYREPAAATRKVPPVGGHDAGGAGGGDDEEMDGFIENDEMDDAAEYGDED